jgi:hypothetical protein
MIHVVAMKCLIGLPLLKHIEILRRSRSRSRSFVYWLHSRGINYYKENNLYPYPLSVSSTNLLNGKNNTLGLSRESCTTSWWKNITLILVWIIPVCLSHHKSIFISCPLDTTDVKIILRVTGFDSGFEPSSWLVKEQTHSKLRNCNL